jgi:uncharacterized protein (TIGR03435 family)
LLESGFKFQAGGIQIMKPLFCKVLCLASVAVPLATNAEPKLGDRAPLLKATTLLQAPAGASLDAESLKGKVVVLEFWATWCGPCVLAMPHLNELAEKFKDKPVVFVSITAEDEATVKAFLAKKPISGWVALDTNRAMNTAYAVSGIPHTIVLGKDGAIAAVTYPTTVTEQFLDDILANKKPALTKSLGGPVMPAGGKPEAAPLFEVSVRPSTVDGKRSSSGSGSLQYRGYSVWELLPEAFEGASLATVWTNAPLPEGKYDVVVRQPRGHSEREAHELLWQAMESAFGLTARKTTNDMEVFVLRKGQSNGPGLTPAVTKGAASRRGKGKIEAVNAPLDWLAWVLEDMSGKPVIDETGLTNRYDISLKWGETEDAALPSGEAADAIDREKLVQAVREQLGLELVTSKRPVVGFVVEKAEKEKPMAMQK